MGLHIYHMHSTTRIIYPHEISDLPSRRLPSDDLPSRRLPSDDPLSRRLPSRHSTDKRMTPHVINDPKSIDLYYDGNLLRLMHGGWSHHMTDDTCITGDGIILAVRGVGAPTWVYVSGGDLHHVMGGVPRVILVGCVSLDYVAIAVGADVQGSRRMGANVQGSRRIGADTGQDPLTTISVGVKRINGHRSAEVRLFAF